jgi:hypothetical protein
MLLYTRCFMKYVESEFNFFIYFFHFKIQFICQTELYKKTWIVYEYFMQITTLVLLHYLCSCHISQLLCQVYLCLDIQYADNIKNVCFYTQKGEKKYCKIKGFLILQEKKTDRIFWNGLLQTETRSWNSWKKNYFLFFKLFFSILK